MLNSKNHSSPNDAYVQNLTPSFVIIVIFWLQRTCAAQMLVKLFHNQTFFQTAPATC